MRIKQFKDEVFGAWFEVHTDFTSVAQSIKSFMDPISGELEIPHKDGFAVTYMYDDNEGRIKMWLIVDDMILQEPIDSDIAALIAHECMHMVDRICEATGVEDTETRAYYIQYLMRQILSLWESEQ